MEDAADEVWDQWDTDNDDVPAEDDRRPSVGDTGLAGSTPDQEAPRWCFDVSEESVRRLADRLSTPEMRWVTWTCDRREERWTKPPRRGDAPDVLARTNDPETWCDLDTALSVARDRRTFGVGVVMRENDDVGFLDIDFKHDGTIDPATATVDALPDWVPDLDRLDGAYIDISPSNAGVRVIARGIERPDWWKNSNTGEVGDNREVQVVESGKYATVTGRTLDGFDTLDRVDPNDFETWLRDVWRALRPTDEEPWIDPTTPERTESDGADHAQTTTGETNAIDPVDVVAATGVADGYPRDGDRSEHDWAIIKEFVRHDVPKVDTERWFFENLPDSKVVERDGVDYGETWTNAVAEVRREDGAIGTRRVIDTTSQETTSSVVSVPASKTEELTNGELPLTPESVRIVAGLGEDDQIADLTDRQKAAAVWTLIRQSSTRHVRVRRDNDGIWAYQDDRGVWTNEGGRALRHAARQSLGATNYGANVLTELKTQAAADPTVEVSSEEFGVDPGYIAVENGLLDLQAAADGADMDALQSLQPDDYALVRLPVTFDPDEGYDEWTTLVEEWAEDDRAAALQEYVGYCLRVSELPIHRALLLVGSGANGKSTFLHVVRALLGADNTTSIELQTLANDLDAAADFYGSVANIDDDLSARKLGAGRETFKKLVAGDRIRGRNLYEDAFEFTPTGKHLYAANQVPQVNVPDDDEAFWRRWLLVEFPNHYPSSQRDPGLRDRLTDPNALSGILNWAIEGHARLLKQGYFTNEERYAQAKRERWQAWGESADRFISECVKRDPDAPRVTTTDAFERYARWCRARGDRPIGQQQFTMKLKQEDVGYKQSVRIDGRPARGYTALGFTGDVPPVEDDLERDEPSTSTNRDESSGRQERLF